MTRKHWLRTGKSLAQASRKSIFRIDSVRLERNEGEGAGQGEIRQNGGMKATSFFLWCILGTWATLATASWMTSGPDDRGQTLSQISQETGELAERVLKATVHFVDVSKRDESGALQRGSGSGFVLDAVRGWVITNHHVAGEPGAVARVRLQNGVTVDGTVIGADPRIDLAVVRIPEGIARHQLAWGDSDALRHGDWVMAVGNPLGLVGTTSLGVVNGLHRRLDLGPGSLSDFLQCDAFIDRGSSGGPLVNIHGEVVGLNTAIEGQAWQGKGWAVPSHLLRHSVKAILEHGKVQPGWLGLTPAAMDGSYAQQVKLPTPQGVRVKSIKEGSPAEDAGVQRGDVILEMDGVPIFTPTQLRARVGVQGPGASIRLVLWRGNQRVPVTLILGQR